MSIPGFGDMLAQKYNIMQQQANTQELGTTAEANLTNTRAGLLPGQTAAEIGLTQAQTKNVGAQAGEVAANAASARGLQSAEAAQGYAGAAHTEAGIPLLGAQTQLTGAQTLGEAQLNSPAPAAGLYNYLYRRKAAYGYSAPQGGGYNISGGVARSVVDQPVQGHAEGTAMIHGKGDGTVDTVPSMLAPGEAVLNKGAAEHIGRPAIELLNAIGTVKMAHAMGDASPETANPGDNDKSLHSNSESMHYANGSSGVGGVTETQGRGDGGFGGVSGHGGLGMTSGKGSPEGKTGTVDDVSFGNADAAYNGSSNTYERNGGGKMPAQHFANGGSVGDASGGGVPPLQPGLNDSYDQYVNSLQAQIKPPSPTQTALGLRKKMTGYATGTSNVPAPGAAPGGGPGVASAAAVPPHLLQALMAGAGGAPGAGMPTPMKKPGAGKAPGKAPPKGGGGKGGPPMKGPPAKGGAKSPPSKSASGQPPQRPGAKGPR